MPGFEITKTGLTMLYVFGFWFFLMWLLVPLAVFSINGKMRELVRLQKELNEMLKREAKSMEQQQDRIAPVTDREPIGAFRTD